jgi:HEPN domain-containing protein/predicted nucleotidyltransferase
MIDRAETVDTVALEMSACIVKVARPWRVILFGSRARGTAKPHSDYDFYIEIDDDARDLRDIDRRIRDSLSVPRASFDLKVVQRGTLERRRDDPGTIEWDVAREGKILFADARASTSIAPTGRVREQPPQTPESVAEWLESAARDERHRRDLWQLEHQYWPEICWLSHQMCEKLMNALLVSRFIRPARTHDLTELLEAMRQNGIDVGPLDADCKLLTGHAITPRYAAGLALTEEGARVADAAAQRLAAGARSQLSR